jgi:hypothetical protein
MNNYPNVRKVRPLLFFCLSILSSFLAPVIAQNTAVHYELVSHVKVRESNPLLKMRMWLKDEPTKENILRLCLVIRDIYKNENRIAADVYSTREGAKKYVEIDEFAGPENESYYSTLRGRYFIDRKQGIEYLDFSDGPNGREKKMTRIELKDTGVALK